MVGSATQIPPTGRLAPTQRTRFVAPPPQVLSAVLVLGGIMGLAFGARQLRVQAEFASEAQKHYRQVFPAVRNAAAGATSPASATNTASTASTAASATPPAEPVASKPLAPLPTIDPVAADIVDALRSAHLKTRPGHVATKPSSPRAAPADDDEDDRR